VKFSQLEWKIGLDQALALCRARLLDGSLKLTFEQWLDILKRCNPDQEIRAQALNEMGRLVTNPGQWFIIFDQAPKGSSFRSAALAKIREALKKWPTFEKVKTAWDMWCSPVHLVSAELQGVFMERLIEVATDFEDGYWIHETAAEIPDLRTFQAQALELMIKTAQDFHQLYILTYCLHEGSEHHQRALQFMLALERSCGESLVVWKKSSGALRQRALSQVLKRAKTFAEWLEIALCRKPSEKEVDEVVYLKLSQLARTFDQCLSVACWLRSDESLPAKLQNKLISLAKKPSQKLTLLAIAKKYGFSLPWTEKNVADSVTLG